MGGALENTYRNAPFVIENYYALCSLLGLLMTVAFVNSAASRDFAFNTHQLLFATPLKKFDYLTGRFLGSALVAVIPMLGVSLGIFVGKWMPWVDPERWGAVNWTAHLYGVLVFAIPNTLFIAAIIFAIAVLTRSTVTSFIGGLVLLTAYGVGQALTTDVQHETWAALLDPFGIRTFALATKYWTVADKNTLAIGYSGLLLWNRVIWLAVGAAIFAFAYWRFRFEERAGRKKKASDDRRSRTALPSRYPAMLRQTFGLGAQWAQFWGDFKVEFWGLVKSTSFIVITCAALLNTIPSIILSASEGYGNTSFPVTYKLIETIQGSLYLFLIGMLTYYAGTLVWKERDARMDEIEDALPHRDWPSYASKLVRSAVHHLPDRLPGGGERHSYAGVQRLSPLPVWVVGHRAAGDGFHSLHFPRGAGVFHSRDFAQQVRRIFRLHRFRDRQPVCVAAAACRDAAGAVRLAARYHLLRLLRLRALLDKLDVVHGVLAGLLRIAGSRQHSVMAARPRAIGWKLRLRDARLRFTAPFRVLAFVLLAAFLGTGAWIYYNTKV